MLGPLGADRSKFVFKVHLWRQFYMQFSETTSFSQVESSSTGKPARAVGLRLALLRASLVLAFLVFASTAASAQGHGRILMTGEKHNWPAGNRTWDITGGVWTTFALDDRPDGQVDTVRVDVNYLPRELGLFWYFTVSTKETVFPLSTGRYVDAMRWPFEDPGHPGFDLSGEGRGNNRENGEFTIHELQIDYSGEHPRVVAFAASFIQHDGDSPNGPAVRGTVWYRDDGGPFMTFPVIQNAKYKKGPGLLKVTGRDFSPGAVLVVDGVVVQPSKVKFLTITAKGLNLTPGLRRVVVRNADGSESFPFEVPVFSFTAQDEPGEPDDVDDVDEDTDSDQ